ncbi:SDR family NAD(P)-dependent oxidoreductase [Acuticoccus sp. MNP-M23]|uniref:SDR family NAD(P)-dependent oxidoreductase n=1 Tax=Acuticoccus sp. MNP-M23 TaxID=3072793 RepID=UPI0028152398|nr:SDR family NAD(P)-dependent oxidoreductase [Acuticoccus sp. MNP-M23]WMS41262.1 SDR family NAD(P)-dependent oxidoreductase [Acuticoccus sp. MNP-M23]
MSLNDISPLSDAERAALAGRLAVVTGASRGIGYAVASLLGACGAQVVAVARTVKGLEELDDEIRAAGGPAATLVPLNLTDGPGVDQLGASIFERWGKLDILVGNAGVLGPISPLGHVKAKDWASAMDVNVSANWRLIRTLDPVLRRSDAARVLFMTAGDASTLRPYHGPYAVSKVALEALARTYALETEQTTIKIGLHDPGAVRTQLRAKAVPGEDASTLPMPADIAPAIARLCLPTSAPRLT